MVFVIPRQITVIVPVLGEESEFLVTHTFNWAFPHPDGGPTVSHESDEDAPHDELHMMSTVTVEISLDVKLSVLTFVYTMGVKERTYCLVSKVFSSTQDKRKNIVNDSRLGAIWWFRFITISSYGVMEFV